jgi:hypothetical protein
MLLEVAEVTVAIEVLRVVRSSLAISKLEPAIVIAVPGTASDGVKLEIDGDPSDDAIVKAEALVAVPAGAVTLMVPVVAPLGTVTVNWVAVAETTVADVPLKETVLSELVVLNAVP